MASKHESAEWQPETPEKPKTSHGPQPGDVVSYVPHACHANQKDRVRSSYPWVIGKVTQRNVGGETVEIIQELTSDRDVELLLEQVAKRPREIKVSDLMRHVRPAEVWPATVRSVNADGTVNLDVQSNQGGVTLHYDGIRIDHEAKTHHTCHPHAEAHKVRSLRKAGA